MVTIPMLSSNTTPKNFFKNKTKQKKRKKKERKKKENPEWDGLKHLQGFLDYLSATGYLFDSTLKVPFGYR